MDDEERRERDGDVNTAGGGSNKGQRFITLSNVVHWLNLTFTLYYVIF